MRKMELHSRLKRINEQNIKIEKTRHEAEKNALISADRKALEQGIKMSEAQQ